MIDRRTFLAGAGAMLLAAPLGVEAQQARKHTIGVFFLGSTAASRAFLDAFREGLRERGYVEADSMIEFRSADDHADRLPAVVAELLALKVEVIVTSGTTAIQAAKNAT